MRVYLQERYNPLQEYRNMHDEGKARRVKERAKDSAQRSVDTVSQKLLGAFLRAKVLGGKEIAANTVAHFKFSIPSASGGLRADRAALNARLKDGSPAFLENDRSNRVSSPADRGTVRKNRQAIHGANTKRGGARYFASKKASAMVESTLDAAKLLRAIDTVCRLADRDTATMNARDKRSHFRSMDHACHQFYQAARLQACPCASCERE